jgi:hypothetical protein
MKLLWDEERQPSRIGIHSVAAAKRLRLAQRTSCRVAFIAADGGGNLGDDAMRALAQAQLRPAQLEPLGPGYLEKRLMAVRLSGDRYFQAGLLGGGTLICPAELDRVRQAVESGLRMWAIGTGAGSSGFEMNREVDISAWGPLLKQFAYVGVRGDLSAKRLAALSVRSEVVGDLALGLAVNRALTPVSERPAIAVNLGGSPGSVAAPSFELDVLNAATIALRPYVTAGWAIFPFAMAPGDVGILERLRELLTLTEPVFVPASAESLVGKLSGCRMTLAMRLHSAVFSVCAGVPPITLSYRDKCVEFMHSVGLSEWSLDPHDTLRQLPDRLAELEGQADAVRAPLLTRAQQLGELSLKRMRDLRAAVVNAT